MKSDQTGQVCPEPSLPVSLSAPEWPRIAGREQFNAFLRSPAVGYVFAALATLIATLTRYELDSVVHDAIPFVLSFLAVLASAFFFGWGPGLLALAGGCVASIYLFVPPRHTLHIADIGDVLRAITFILVGAAAISIIELQRQSRRRVEKAMARLKVEIAERRQTADKLARSEELYRSLFESNLDAVVTVDRGGNIVTVNPAGVELCGYSLDELRRMMFAEVCLPDQLPGFRQHLQLALDGKSGAMELTLIARDERRVEVFVTVGPVIVNGETTGAFAIIRDISARKRADVRLAAFTKLGQSLSSVTSPIDAGRIIGDVAGELFGWDAFSLALYYPANEAGETVTSDVEGEEGEKMAVDHILYVDTLDKKKVEIRSSKLGKNVPALARRIMREGKGELILKREPLATVPGLRSFGDSRPSASLMFVPLRDKGRSIGILSIQSYKMQAYQARDLEDLQTLADYCGGALQRIRTEEALRETENRFASFMENLAAGAWMKDAQGRYLYTNAELERIFRIPATALHGKTDAEAFLPGTAPQFTEANWRIRESGATFQSVETINDVRGRRHFIVNQFPIPDRNGDMAMVAGIAVDITQQKQAEEALALSNERLELIARVINTVVGAAPLKDQLTELAGHICATYEVDACVIRLLNRNELVLLAASGVGEKALSSRFPIAGTLGEEVINRRAPIAIPDVPARLGAARTETFAPHGYPFVSYAGAPMLAKNQFVGVIAIYGQKPRDFSQPDLDNLQSIANHIAVAIVNDRLYLEVSRQKSQLEEQMIERRRAAREIGRLNADLEQRVRERTAQLEASNQELEAFSYSVSHDLRAPLRSICGFTQVLLEDYANQLEGEARDCLDRVVQSSRHMDQLIEDLLHLSRFTRADLMFRPIDLSALATGIAAELQRGEPDRKVEFVIAPDATAQGDERLARIALENLLNNAWKFTSKCEKARIEFGMKLEPDGTVFFVRDNGAGFDMDYANKLFGAFQRLHSAAEFPGHGIGLATVRRIINRHAGRTWAVGAVGEGATFHFTLPGTEPISEPITSF